MNRTIRIASSVVLSTVGLLASRDAASATAVPDDPDAQVMNLDDGTVVVYGDGRVFRRVTGAAFAGLSSAGFADRSPRMAPPPAPSSYEVAELTDEGLEWLIDRADELGMLVDDPDYGDAMITDNPTSTLVITIDDETFEHSVYAPGYDVDGRVEQERREHFREFSDTLYDVESEIYDAISDFEPWLPEAWIVSERSWLFDEPTRDWPLDELPVPGDCVILPVDDDQDTATGAYIGPDGTFVVADAALPGTECAPDDVTDTTAA
jgi:hypothetical protein